MAESWVVNASPLIVLAKVGQIGLLNALADAWVVPDAVVQEVTAGPVDDPGRKFVERLPPERRCTVEVPDFIASWDLDPGESEVLAWACENREYAAVVDDLAARKCARVLGITVFGTVGILVQAKRVGLIAALRPILIGIRTAGLRINDEIESAALELTEES